MIQHSKGKNQQSSPLLVEFLVFSKFFMKVLLMVLLLVNYFCRQKPL